jgi:hypothetical protein
MATGPADVLLRHAREGFRQFPGIRLSGTVPITDAIINELLSQSPQVPKHLRVEIESGNRLVARIGVVQAAATLQSPAIVDGPPTITLLLASTIVAWTVSRYLRAPFIAIDGRVITVDLARIPALQPWQAALHHVERLTFSTAPGLLTIGFDWHVTPEASRP